MNKKVNGFMGRTHSLLSVILMAVCMLVPLYPLKITFGQLRNNVLLFIVALAVLVGGALLPDLDADNSSAKATLGPIGTMFTLFMKSTSSVIWNVYHFKGDKKPENQHRYLWHTPIIGIGMILLFYFGLKGGNYTILTNIKNSITEKQFGYFLRTNAILVLFMLLCFMAVLTGTSILFSTLRKILPIPYIIRYIFPVGVLVYIFTTNYTNLRILGVCLGAGYLMHCIEDLFCDSSIPVIWPIPAVWKNKVWWKPHFPFSIKTGGTLNTIIDLISVIVATALIIFVFIKK